MGRRVLLDPRPAHAVRNHPVKSDYPGFDETSRLDRDGVFRLNLAIGREALRDRVKDTDQVDPAAFDALFPHPLYADHGWISVLNPDSTESEVRSLINVAYARATAKE